MISKCVTNAIPPLSIHSAVPFGALWFWLDWTPRAKLRQMAAKKKSAKKKPSKKAKKKPAKTRRIAGKKQTSVKKLPRHQKKSVKKVTAAKNAKKAKSSPKIVRNTTARPRPMKFSRERPSSRLDEQSGDLQGLSRIEEADSESVDELVEEGNAFEADVVSGVERAGNEEGREVRTHEVPEDDVPGEYLDDE